MEKGGGPAFHRFSGKQPSRTHTFTYFVGVLPSLEVKIMDKALERI
jgi:hypothetical protein